MATEESVYPKIGNDPLFASEVNSFTDKKLASVNSVNIIQQLLNSNTPFSGVNFVQDSQLSFQQAGSYWNKQGTVYHPHYDSGTHNKTIDEHDDSSIDTALWDVSGGDLDSVDEDTNWMFMNSSAASATETGSIFGKENIFDTYGPAIRINLGSIHRTATLGGTSVVNFTVFLDTVSLTGAAYETTGDNFDTFDTSGAIDLLRLSGNTFLFRLNEGNWSGDTFTSGKVGFILRVTGDTGETAVGSALIDNEVYVSGLFNTQIQLSGVLPSGVYNYAIYNYNPGSLNALTGSSFLAEFSFDDGTNFVDFIGSQRQWTLNNDIGSEFVFRYKQDILHKASGLAQGTINNFGIMYGAT